MAGQGGSLASVTLQPLLQEGTMYILYRTLFAQESENISQAPLKELPALGEWLFFAALSPWVLDSVAHHNGSERAGLMSRPAWL